MPLHTPQPAPRHHLSATNAWPAGVMAAAPIPSSNLKTMNQAGRVVDANSSVATAYKNAPETTMGLWPIESPRRPTGRRR